MFQLLTDQDNTIIWKEDCTGPDCFDSAKGLLAIADERKLSREDLEGIWNGFAGTPHFAKLKPIKKFRNRPHAVKMIFKAVQTLAPSTEAKPATKPKAERKAKAKAKSKPTKKARSKRNPQRATKPVADAGPRAGSKTAGALELMRRKKGATCEELEKLTGWKAPSVRTLVVRLQQKHGIKVETEKDEKRGTVYRIAA